MEHDGALNLPDLTKLKKIASEAQDAREVFHIKVEIRNRLIVDALNIGYPQKIVAEAAGLKPPQITKIVGEVLGNQ